MVRTVDAHIAVLGEIWIFSLRVNSCHFVGSSTGFFSTEYALAQFAVTRPATWHSLCAPNFLYIHTLVTAAKANASNWVAFPASRLAGAEAVLFVLSCADIVEPSLGGRPMRIRRDMS